ncbi:MAG: nuclear transport factor 2 family protein [Actinomycetota bacterium]
MSRIESQLREYFDAGVERITADDVFARARVEEGGLERLHVQRSRPTLNPAWAAVGAFVITLLGLGGLAAVLSLAPNIVDGVDVGAAEIVESNGGTLSVWIVAALAAAVAAGITVWFVRRPRGGDGGDPDAEPEQGRVKVMETIESTEERAEMTEHRSRWPMIVIALLAVALVAALLWMTLAMRPNSPNAAPPEIVELMEEYNAAWNAYDVDALEALVTSGYRIHAPGGSFDHDIESVRWYLMPLLEGWEWQTTIGGSFYAVAQAPDSGTWYVSSEGSVVNRSGTDYPQNGVWRVVVADGGYLVAEHFFMGG